MQGGNATLRLRRNAERSIRKGEQTERAFHPVDGTPERLGGPVIGKVPDGPLCREKAVAFFYYMEADT